MRMKSIFASSVLAASTLLSGMAQAQFWQVPNSNFLLGGEFGYANDKKNLTNRFTTSPNVFLPFTPPAISEHKDQRIGDRGTMMGLLAGWQWRCYRYMVGLEGNVDFQDFERVRKYSFSDGVVPYYASAVYDRGPIFALTTRFGYFVTPGFMPYLRIGGQVSRDEAQFQVFVAPNNSGVPTNGPRIPVPYALSDSSSHKRDIYGGVAGLGVEFPAFIGASTARIEYTFSRTDRLAIDDNAGIVQGVHKFRYPETNAFKFVWVWNFI